jgi:hypothetical protein
MISFQDMGCIQDIHHHRTHEGLKLPLLMMAHIIPVDIKGVVEVEGSERVLHHMEEGADHMAGAILEKISSILMENMFTGIIQIYHQEKVIGYVRIPGNSLICQFSSYNNLHSTVSNALLAF